MVDKQVVENAAKLARIEISENEKEYLTGQLSKILEYIDKLKEADIKGIEPLRGPHTAEGFFREDCPRDCLCREDILKNAPCAENNCFKVPQVID